MKPGIKTSEFWVALLVPFLGGIGVGVFELYGVKIPVDTIYAGVGTALGYILNRAWVKGKALEGTQPEV